MLEELEASVATRSLLSGDLTENKILIGWPDGLFAAWEGPSHNSEITLLQNL